MAEQLLICEDKEFRHSLNIFLPSECTAGKDLPPNWFVLALQTEAESEEPKHCFISPKGKQFTSKDSALRHADAEKKGKPYETSCSGNDDVLRDADMNEDEGDEPAKEPDDESMLALTFASSNYFEDWLNRGCLNHFIDSCFHCFIFRFVPSLC